VQNSGHTKTYEDAHIRRDVLHVYVFASVWLRFSGGVEKNSVLRGDLRGQTFIGGRGLVLMAVLASRRYVFFGSRALVRCLCDPFAVLCAMGLQFAIPCCYNPQALGK